MQNYDARLRLLRDEFLVVDVSQLRIPGTDWYLHYRGGPQPVHGVNNYLLRCVVADNPDHGRPHLQNGTQEYVVRWGAPFAPVRFRVAPPGVEESFIILIAFEDVTASNHLAEAPLVETEVMEPSWIWRHDNLPF